MKKILFYTILCGIFGGMQAQAGLTLRAKRNSFRAGESLLKQQVVFRDPGNSGKNLTWDFRHLQPVNQDYSLRYFIPDSTRMTRLCGLEHRTLYYYEQSGDSLFATGYENYTTFAAYVQPELRMVFPFAYGDTLRSEFEGRGEYGRRLKLSVKGSTRVEADAEGELILPDETVKKALRVRTLRHYTEAALARPSDRPEDGKEMILDTYSWYAQGVRYPVFESIKTSILSNSADTTVFETSFYYPPSEQRMQTEEEEDDEYTDENELPESAASVFTEADLLPNPVINTLNIKYILTRNALIWFTVHNNPGLCMAQTAPQHQPEGYNETPVNMSACPTGVYTLYVHVDDMVMSLNVVKM